MTNDQASTLRASAPSKLNIAARKSITCLTVASGKGGVGKTFLSVNLALAFKELNKKVLLVDADLGLANADIVLGVNPDYTMQDALFQGYSLSEVVSETPYGIDLLAASSGTKEMTELGQARIRAFLEELLSFAADYDVLIFDCSAGINSSVTSFIAASPQALVVATPQPTSIMDVYALMKVIHQENLSNDVGLVMNMVEDPVYGQSVVDKLMGVASAYLSISLRCYGIIPYSNAVTKAVHSRTPILSMNADDKAAKKIKEIAKSILQKQKATTKLRNLDAAGILKGLLRTGK